jgi:pilus assembly protein CpaE
VLGCADPEITGRITSVLAELGDELVKVATSSAETLDAVAQVSPEVLVVADSLGPVPVLDLIRQVARQDPFTGILLLSSSADPELYRVAMEAGARSVAPIRFTVDDLGQRLDNAASWARIVRSHIAGEASRAIGTGHVVALAGSKGGVGTTTIAVHTALEAAAAGRRTCLVDLDLQTGDVAALLDITHRRDVVDLVVVADEISGQTLNDALYRHASGLHVLLAPREGERGEEVIGPVSRAVLGALKSRFDVIVVDVGNVLSAAGAAAIEIADRVVVVATPDVLSVRGARRMVQLWDRLQLRRESEVTVLLNRISRNVEVQPDLAARLVKLPISDVAIPASFKAFEAATNTGDPARVVDRETRRALARVAESLGVRNGVVRQGIGLLAAEAAPTPIESAGGLRRRGRRSSGQTSVEFLGMMPILLVSIFLVYQASMIGLSFVLAGHAASVAARVAVSPEAGFDDIAQQARDALPGAWKDNVQVRVDGRSSFGGGDPRYADPDSEVTVQVVTPGMFAPIARLFGEDGLTVRSTAQMRFEGRR